MNVSEKDFGMKSKNDCLVNQRNKDKYKAYQSDYREQYGVYPELDIKNSPFFAIWNDCYNEYTQYKKSGFLNSWIYHDLRGQFNKKLKKLYHTYKKEWSFLISIDAEATVKKILTLPIEEKIVDGLGYKKEENGDYYEGTWSDGKLVYGLFYNSAQGVIFVGKISTNASVKEYHGVICGDKVLNVGISFKKEDTLIPYKGISFTAAANNGTEFAIIGSYEEGYAHGKFYSKYFYRDGIKFVYERYKDGESTYTSGSAFGFWHFILAITNPVMIYFIIKFTYGLPIYLIYRAHQKRNWL